MRRRIASLIATCMLCWAACEDRTFVLTEDAVSTHGDGANTSGTTEGLMNGSGGTGGSSPAASDGEGHDNSTTSFGGGGSVNGFGQSSFTSDAGGNGPKGGPDDGNVGSGGSGANGNLSSGGEGGQGPGFCASGDMECLICTQGITKTRTEDYCAVPTYDCEDDHIWDEICRHCNPEADACPSNSMGALRCFGENAKCLPACDDHDDCGALRCHPEAQVCVSCYQDQHCPDSWFSHCLAGRCYECRVSEDCVEAGRGKYCIAGQCRRCLVNEDCEPGQLCGLDDCVWPQ